MGFMLIFDLVFLHRKYSNISSISTTYRPSDCITMIAARLKLTLFNNSRHRGLSSQFF